MPISLAQIAANTAKVTFQYMLTAEDGTQSTEEVNVVYYPGRFTEKIIAQMQVLSQYEEATILADMEAFNVTLCKLMKSWDVYEDTERTVMFPIVPERLAELPLIFRMEVILAIIGDLRPEAMAPQMATLNSSH